MVKLICKFVIRVALIVVGILGIIFTTLSTDFMGGSSVFLFFTVQSNITIMAITLIFLIDDVLKLLGRKSFINQVFYMIKFVFVVAISVTFIVFFTLLAPLMGIDYLLSFNNFSLHAIVPILAIVDFFLFDTDFAITYLKSIVGTAMPLYYVFFVYIGVPLKFQYGENLYFPYFFLDYKTNGFFFEKGVGVVIWIIILLVFIVLLGFLYCFFLKLRQKYMKKEEQNEQN